ncbi:3D domain-containing protein [Planctomycetota bacterium]|nr:3D domain-containing protein [Planctomycetota bacterium]
MSRDKERLEGVYAPFGGVSPLVLISLVIAMVALLSVCVLKLRGAVHGEGSGIGTASLMAIDQNAINDVTTSEHQLEYYTPENLSVSNNELETDDPVVVEEDTQWIEAWDDEYLVFDGKVMRKKGVLRMKVTAYSPDAQSCGKWADGITASGKSVETNGGMLVAADTRMLPFGTVLTVPGYNDGDPVQVLDRGGKIKGHRLDVLYPTHKRALKWGVQNLDVAVWEHVD